VRNVFLCFKTFYFRHRVITVQKYKWLPFHIMIAKS